MRAFLIQLYRQTKANPCARYAIKNNVFFQCRTLAYSYRRCYGEYKRLDLYHQYSLAVSYNDDKKEEKDILKEANILRSDMPRATGRQGLRQTTNRPTKYTK